MNCLQTTKIYKGMNLQQCQTWLVATYMVSWKWIPIFHVQTSCNNKKMVTLREKDIELYFMFCNSCQSRYKTNSCNNYLRAVLLMNSNGNEKKITAFLPHIKKMYESRGIEFVFSFDRRELMSSMMNILPIEVKYSLVNNTVKNLICKRLHNE